MTDDFDVAAALTALPAEIRNRIFPDAIVLTNQNGSMRLMSLTVVRLYGRRLLNCSRANLILYHNIMPIFLGQHIFRFEQCYEDRKGQPSFLAHSKI